MIKNNFYRMLAHILTDMLRNKETLIYLFYVLICLVGISADTKYIEFSVQIM